MIPQSFQKPKNSTLGKEIRIWREGCRDWKCWWLFKPLKICRNLGWSHNLPGHGVGAPSTERLLLLSGWHWIFSAEGHYLILQGSELIKSIHRTWTQDILLCGRQSSLPGLCLYIYIRLLYFPGPPLLCTCLDFLSFPLHLAQNSSFKVQFKSKFILYFPPKQPR